MFTKRSSSYLIVDDIAIPQRPARRWPKLMTLVIALLAAAALSSQQRVQAAGEQQMLSSRSQDGVVGAGLLLFNSKPGGEFHPAISLSGEAHFDVSGMIAQVTCKQSFVNDSDAWLEGVYVFPLPEDASVNKLQIRIGERVIDGAVREKSTAKTMYRQAKSSGRKASLVEQERDNLFTSSIANIAPGEIVEVQIHYLQEISYTAGAFGLRFPMTITPRYIPGQPLASDLAEQDSSLPNASGWAANTDQVSDAARITPVIHPAAASERPINPIRISAAIDMGMPLQNIRSAYHDIDVVHSGDRYSVSLTAGSVAMTQDFNLTWQPQSGVAPQAVLFTETRSDQEFALLMIVPPQHYPPSPMAKEQIYVIDTSGSMAGVPIRQAKQSLLLALAQLNTQDRFNIIEFNSHTLPLFHESRPASRDNIAHARRFVRRLRARGGTEMAPALSAALHTANEESDLRQVIFITDGAVGNEAALFKQIQRQLGENRLFTVGIGSAPNTYFMRKAAQFGRGSFTYIGDVNEVNAQMQQLFSKLNSPVLRHIAVHWPAGIRAETYPPRVPDLYYGEPLLLSAKLSAIPDSITVLGTAADNPWRQELFLRGDLAANDNSAGVATLWARRKIASLLDEIVMGRAEQDVRAEVLPLALDYQLASPFTSFVAVEQQVSNTTGESPATIAIPNARPKGQGLQSFAYPAGASHAMQSIGWGLLLLSFGAIIRFCIRKEELYAGQA